MKMLVNRRPVDGPWGGGNHFIKSLYKHSQKNGIDIVNAFEQNLDAIFLIDPRYDELGISIREVLGYKQAFPDTKIIYRVNECDKRKGESNQIDPLIGAIGQVSDLCFFISNWIHQYHVNHSWICENNVVIPNGTDTRLFHPREKDPAISKPISLVTHHWSNNFMKGFDIYKEIDSWVANRDDFMFTYIGRSHGPLPNSEIVPPIHGETLGRSLAKHDVYISASKWDPGPNHVIESLACQIPTYAHFDGGGAAEFVGQNYLYKDFNELLALLEKKEYVMNSEFVPSSWDDTIQIYIEKIIELF